MGADTRQQTPLKEFDSARYGGIRLALISKKGSEGQVELLEAARKNSTFISWIRGRGLAGEPDAKHLTLIDHPLTENEFKNTPTGIEEMAFDAWKDQVTPSVAYRPGFWGCATLNHIENDLIKSSFLAAPLIAGESGLTRIEIALSKKGTDKQKDDAVRAILRRFSGLPEARGGLRSVRVNCVFGKAWWRSHILEQILETTNGDRDEVTRTLRHSSEYWEKLMSVLTARNSVFGDAKVRSTLVYALSVHVGDEKYKNLFKAKGAIDKCMDLLGVYSAIQEFGVFESEELREFIERHIIETCVDTPSDDGDGLSDSDDVPADGADG